MVDLTAEMAQLWTSLGSPTPGRARAILFVAARDGEGTSTVAREFARYGASRARKPVWLVDLDLMNAPQYRALAGDPQRFGALGRQTAASPDGSAFFTVQPPVRDPDGRAWPDGRLLVAHPVGASRLWVTRFRRERLELGQKVQVIATSDYWTALRAHAELVVVDAPSAERSDAATLVTPFMDSTVLVVSADDGDAAARKALKEAIVKAGGRCAGLFFNRADLEPPEFLRAITP